MYLRGIAMGILIVKIAVLIRIVFKKQLWQLAAHPSSKSWR
jgi:hypothetical protein